MFLRRFPHPVAALGGGAATDPDFGSVVLLAGFNGVDGATTYTAETGQTFTIAGSSSLDDTQVKYGTTSWFANGSNGSFPDEAGWDLSAANGDQFTIEWYQYLPNLLNVVLIMNANWNFNGWMIRANGTTFEWFANTSGGSPWSVTKASAGFTANQWDECCIEKNSSGLMRMYINGAMVHSTTPADSTIQTVTGPLLMGITGVNGWLDEVRITKGVARYNSDSGYTPHTSQFPRS